MAGLKIYSSTNCGIGTAIPGTGLSLCNITDFGQLKSVTLANKGTNILLSTFSQAEILKLVKARKLHNLYDFLSIRQNNSKMGVYTSEIGLKNKTIDGLIEFEMDFDRGTAFDDILSDLSGTDKWDLILNFQSGSLFVLSDNALSLMGLNMGMFEKEEIEFNVGASGKQKSMVVAQIKDTDAPFVFKSKTEMGFLLSKMPKVLDCMVTLTQPVVGNTLTAKVEERFTGISVDVLTTALGANWKLFGTQATPRTVTAAVYNTATEDYTLTLSGGVVLTDTVQVGLRDGIYDVAQDITGQLYAGKSALLTV